MTCNSTEPVNLGPLQRLAPEAKLVAVVAFVLIVVATPARAWLALAFDVALLVALVLGSGLRPGKVFRGLVIELPFLCLAVLMPFVAFGPRVAIGPLQLSQAGLTGGALLLVRSTLGVLAALVLAATTEPNDLVGGLERLRLPAGLVSILTLMVRFLAVVGDDLNRMAVARASRGDGRTRALRMAATAAGAGTLFVRSYERGERVHLAMAARGHDGRLPAYGARPRAAACDWIGALSLPLIAAAALAIALWQVGL